MVNKGNDPQMALIQVSEILYLSQMNAIAATMATPGPPWRHQGHGVELLFFARLGGEKNQ